MTVKTLTITQEAYDALKSQKNEEESFSDVIKRIAGKKMKIKDLAGALKMTDSEWAEFSKRVKETREGLGSGLKKRIDYVRSRFVSNN